MFERDLISLNALTSNGCQPSWKDVTDYYLAHSNRVSVKAKLPVSRCFAALGSYSEASALAAEYIGTYSNDFRGWRVLGCANLAMDSYAEATTNLLKAAELGDGSNFAALGFAAYRADRFDVLREKVVPRLMELKDARETPRGERLEMLFVVVIYAIKTEDEALFRRAMDGVSPQEMDASESLKKAVAAGRRAFEEERRQRTQP